ncbi:MAG: TolC family protein [Bernardetiaceae bacterium]
MQLLRAALLLVALLAKVSLLAQPEPLSLADAIGKALQENFDIQIEKQRIRRATLDNNWGDAGRFPSLNLDLQQGNTVTNIDNPAAFLTGDILNNNFQPSLALNWTLFDGWRVRANKARLDALQEETKGNADIVIENTIQELIKGYYLATLEWERLQVQAKLLGYSRDRYAYVQLRKDLGSAVSADLLLEETNFLGDSIAYLNQRLAYQNALRNLNQLMGQTDINAEYLLTDSLKAVPKTFDISDLQTQMLVSNANLYRQYLTQQVAAQNVQLAKAAQYPTIDLTARASQNRNRQDLSGAQLISGNSFENPVNTAITTSYSGGLGLRFTIFNGGQIKRAIQRAQIEQDLTQVQFDRQQQLLLRDLHNLLDTYNTRRQLLRIARQSEAVAQQNFDISQERFRLGTINSLDLRIIQNNLLNAANAARQAVYNLIATETDLLRLTGGILQEEK